MPSPPAISIAPRRLSTTLPLPSCALAASPMPVNTPSPPCATTSLTAPVPRRMSRRRSIWSPTSPKPPPADSSGPVQCATVEPDVVRRYRYVLRTGEGTPGRSRFLQVVFEVLSLVHEAVNECCTARPDLTLKRVVWPWYVPPFPLHDPSDELLVPLRRFDDRGAHPGPVRQAPDGFIIHGHEYLRPRERQQARRHATAKPITVRDDLMRPTCHERQRILQRHNEQFPDRLLNRHPRRKVTRPGI